MGELITVKKMYSTSADCTDRSRCHVRSLSCLQYLLARLNYECTSSIHHRHGNSSCQEIVPISSYSPSSFLTGHCRGKCVWVQVHKKVIQIARTFVLSILSSKYVIEKKDSFLDCLYLGKVCRESSRNLHLIPVHS